MSNQPQRHARYRPSLYRAPARPQSSSRPAPWQTAAPRPPGSSMQMPGRSHDERAIAARARKIHDSGHMPEPGPAPGQHRPVRQGCGWAHAVSTRLKARLTGPRQTAHSRYRLTRSPSLRTVTAPGRYFPFAGRAAAPAGPSRLPPLLVARAVSDSCSDVGRPLLRLRSLVVRRGLTAMARRLAASPGWLNTPQVLLVIVGGPAPLWPGALPVDTPADPSP